MKLCNSYYERIKSVLLEIMSCYQGSSFWKPFLILKSLGLWSKFHVFWSVHLFGVCNLIHKKIDESEKSAYYQS